ncbi:hypothetical protein Q3G72_023962 [Acer saccharum]|nr:hypothetical protein Q3G72_023962 [Acer saccharum]
MTTGDSVRAELVAGVKIVGARLEGEGKEGLELEKDQLTDLQSVHTILAPRIRHRLIPVNQLRRSIFEDYSGILQGFKNEKAEVMMPYAQHLLQFIELVFTDRQRDESVTRAAVAVIGDLANALGPNTKILFKDCSFCAEFMGECLQSDDEQLKETTGWTLGMIGRVMVS